MFIPGGLKKGCGREAFLGDDCLDLDFGVVRGGGYSFMEFAEVTTLDTCGELHCFCHFFLTCRKGVDFTIVYDIIGNIATISTMATRKLPEGSFLCGF